MAVYREFEYILWALATMGPGMWATWNWDQGPGPGPSLGLGLGPWPAWAREPGRAWDQVGLRAQAGPGLPKKHDSAMKMKHLDAKSTTV